MEKKVQFFLFVILLFSFTILISAASISNDLHLNIQTTTSGSVTTGTFNFVFNISNSSNCSDNSKVVYSNSTTLTTDSRGIISYYLPNVSLDYDQQYWLCYYRDGTLINSSKIARTPYTFRARNITLSGVEVDSNFNMGNYNFTVGGGWASGGVSILGGDIYAQTGYFYNITSLNVTRQNLSIVDDFKVFGNTFLNKNLTVDTNTLFVDSNLNRVGIGTTTPSNFLQIVGGAGTDLDPLVRLSKLVDGSGSATGILIGAVNTGNAKAGIFFENQGIGSGRGKLYFSLDNTNDESDADISDAVMTLTNSGYVGIGTTTPTGKLNVVGNVSITTDLLVDTNTLFVNSDNNNIGIGTTSPVSALQVAGDITQASGRSLIKNVVHKGVKENYAGNTGLGQSTEIFNSWSNYMSSEYADYYSLFYGTWGDYQFSGGIWDGEYLWMVPSYSPSVVRVNPATGEMTNYSHGHVNYAFYGGCFDGEAVWFAPFHSDYFMKIYPENGTMINYTNQYGDAGFSGCVFTGNETVFIPEESDKIVAVNSSNAFRNVTNINISAVYGSIAFNGGIWDGEYVWMVPYSSSSIVRVNVTSGELTNYTHGSGVSAYGGGCFDGELIWFAPSNSDTIDSINPSTGEITKYTHGESNDTFIGCTYDGISLWFAPLDSSNVIKMDPRTGKMIKKPHNQRAGGESYRGAVFDGESVWLIPFQARNLTRIRPPEFGRDSLFTSGNLNVGGNVSIGERVGIGTSSPNEPLEVVIAAGSADLGITSYSTTNSHVGRLIFQKSASDTKGTLTETASGDYLGGFIFRGISTGSTKVNGAWIQATQEAAAAADRVPTQLDFYVNDATTANLAISINSSGDVEIEKQLKIDGASRISVNQGSAQTIADSTTTILTFETEDYDNLGEFNGTTFIPQKSGYYFITGFVSTDVVAWTNSHTIRLWIYKNGAEHSLIGFNRFFTLTTKTSIGGGSRTLYLSAGDHVDLRVRHNRGANTDTSGSGTENYLDIHRLS